MRTIVRVVLLMLWSTHVGLVDAADSSARPMRIVASFSVVADMVRTITGDAAEVTSLVGPNMDAHVFEPAPADVRRLRDADLVIVNGLGFEGWIDRLIQSSGYKGPIVVASTGIEVRMVKGQPDPHAWQSLANGLLYVDNVQSALSRLLPNDRVAFEVRAADYKNRLLVMDRDVRARFATIPRGRRRVITSHDAFGYFGAAYDVDFIAPQGWSTDSEASAASVAGIVRQIRMNGVHALFVENMMDPRLIQRVAEEAKVTVGGTLYSDALSPPGTEADTYVRMFEHNSAALLRALR